MHLDHKKNNSMSGLFDKLAIRNVKKSTKDYFVYFFTLMLSVCLFYSFNSISTQFASLGLEDNLNYLAFSSSMLTAFSLLVCVIMGVLIVHANGFLLRRRKKEMGVYSVLGMSRKNLNRLLMKETLWIGIISVAAGLILGIFVAQILSLATAKLIGISLTSYRFMISIKAIFMSIFFFFVLFFFVYRFNIKELNKMSLLDMLYADRKNETVGKDSKVKTGLLAVVSILFLAAGYGVTVVQSGQDAFRAMGLGGLLLMIGTGLFFTAFLKIIAGAMKKNKRFYYRKLNMFTVSQFSARLNTEGRFAALISVLLFLSLALTAIGPGMGKHVMNGIENATPFHGTISYAPQAGNAQASKNPEKYLQKSGFHVKEFSKEKVGVWIYETSSVTEKLLKKENGKNPLSIIGVDDYNRILKLQKKEPVHLENGEYGVSYAFPSTEKTIKAYKKNPKAVHIGSHTLKIAENGVYHVAWENKNVLTEGGTIIVPQNLTKNLKRQRWVMNFNFPKEKKEQYASLFHQWTMTSPEGYTLWSRQEALVSITADNLLVTYLGIYLGITFLITAGAALALQQLSQVSDNEKRYKLLRKLGVSKKDMLGSLKKQLTIYFGFPLILALLNAAVVIVVIFQYFEGLTLAAMSSIIGFSALLTLLVYAVYFIATYIGGKRIL